jgi:two-component system sensor histidine kinase AgrC
MEVKGLKGMESIPKGGLKGLIYYKLSDLKGINIITNISPNIKKHSFFKCNSPMYNDVLKIIGIYIDNAIEACSNAKEKEIAMEIYCQKNEFHFILSNTYDEIRNISRLEEIGYSTKGKNRGYGLYLVKKIIEKYDSIYQTREVNEKYYTIHLTIKI